MTIQAEHNKLLTAAVATVEELMKKGWKFSDAVDYAADMFEVSPGEVCDHMTDN
jgi:hypothetical protein